LAVRRCDAARRAAFAALLRAAAAEAAAAVWAKVAIEGGSSPPGAGRLAEGCGVVAGLSGGAPVVASTVGGDESHCGNEGGQGCADGSDAVGDAAQGSECQAAAAAAAAARGEVAERAAEHTAAVAKLRAWVCRLLGNSDAAAGDVAEPPTGAAGPTGGELPTPAGAPRLTKRLSSRYSGLGGRRALWSQRGATEYLGPLGSAPRSALLQRRAVGRPPMLSGQDGLAERGDQLSEPREQGTGGSTYAAGAGVISLPEIEPDEIEPDAARVLTSGDTDADAAEMLGGVVKMANTVGGWPELLAPLGIQRPGRPDLWVTLHGGIDQAAAEAAASRARAARWRVSFAL
jgi:hypothetical protein